VAATDADNDALTFSAAAQSTVPVTALSPTGQFSWNTTGAAPGSYELTYFATDGTANSPMQTVAITLTPAASAVAPAGGGGGGGGGALPLLQLLLLGAADRAVDSSAQTVVRVPYRRPRRSGAPAARPLPATAWGQFAARLFGQD
jgi:hypothetical protein